MYSTEKLFWKRVENLEKAIKEAKNIDFKAVWTDKLRELMKKLPKRLINQEYIMIEILNFIDELKDIKKSLGVNTDNKTMNLIDKTISKYENQVEEFENEMASASVSVPG